MTLLQLIFRVFDKLANAAMKEATQRIGINLKLPIAAHFHH
jgi:hypothetical protein